MHDAIGVVNGHGPVLTETPPLEGGAERADLHLLVLLLPGELHKHLQDAEVKSEQPLVLVKNSACRLASREEEEEENNLHTCSKVDWEKLYSSKLKVRLAKDAERQSFFFLFEEMSEYTRRETIRKFL